MNRVDASVLDRLHLSHDGNSGRGGPVIDLLPFPALLIETATGRVIVANEAARAQRPGGDAAGLPWDGGRLNDPRTGGPFDAGTGEGLEVTWPNPAGERSYRVFCRPVPSADGRTPLALVTLLDVTREKATEAELRQAVEARDEFFSVATHELKDPLFSLQLSIELLQHSSAGLGELPANVLHHLEVSQRQVDRLTRMVENLLDVSRIINHRLEVDAETLDLCELARESAERLAENARQAGALIRVEADGPVVGFFDRLKLEQVIGNLLTNAIKYGQGRPITLRVRGTKERAEVEVEDHGIGIAAADQERVFRRFERASPGHRRDSLGLGLYIVRSFVEAHGGSVGLRSEPGRGSIFIVTLPWKSHPLEPGGSERALSEGRERP